MNRYINGDNESVTIGGLNKKAFITNFIQEEFNGKASVNVIKIISLPL